MVALFSFNDILQPPGELQETDPIHSHGHAGEANYTQHVYYNVS